MSVALFDEPLQEKDLDAMANNARTATDFLKALGHEGRLMILCYLADGERSVTELEELLAARQPAVSQQLARLRIEGLVDARREGKTIYYSIADAKTRKAVEFLYNMFCRDSATPC
ncbi:MAG: metalloregulator ArsR/SmtB family transcription factor [Nitratireductor sp.]|nr:winged helix-turn-helix transcriptional regulator [Nitratireductor sp.]